MNLTFNNTNLSNLGTLRILGRSTRREPAEAPQRERVEYRVRIDFFQQSFPANYGLVQNLNNALQVDLAQLTWTDGNGTTYENRPVTAGDSEVPRDVLEKGGTYWQAIEFSFWFWNHSLRLNTLNGAFTPANGGAAQDLGAVEFWSEQTRNERFDPLRDQRKTVTGVVQCSGRWQADTTTVVASRHAALLAKKDQLTAALVVMANGTVQYGTFNQVVRVTEFRADVNQPENYVGWSASFSFTRYPNETDYALLEYEVTTRFDETVGIHFLTLTGKIQAPTEAAARTRLGAVQTSVVPANYSLMNTQAVPRTVGSESNASGGNLGQSDGLTFVELSFTVEYRDKATQTTTLTLTPPGGGTGPTINLGTVDKFRDAVAVQRFSDLRDQRRRESGTVTLAGRWYALDTDTPAAQQASLDAAWLAMDSNLVTTAAGVLSYGTIFNQQVRVVDFTADLDKVTNSISWTLVATWTRYPDETDYALLDYTVTPRYALMEGIHYLTVAGRIEGPAEAQVRARLAALQASPGLVPAGYALVSVQSSPRTVASESTGTGAGNASGDGTTFIELTFSIEYRDTSALPATYQNLSVGGALTFGMGTVDKFRDGTTITRWDELRDTRKRAAGTVMMAGRWYVSDGLSAGDQQAQLTAQKQLFDAQLLGGNRGQLTYAGIFNQAVRVTSFTAEINRLTNCILWTLEATFTRYPDEANYALVEYRAQKRLNKPDGINFLTLTGKIHAPSAAAASVLLAQQAAAVVPSNYVTLNSDISPATVGSLSDGGGDGLVFTEINFALEYRDIATIACTYQRTAVNAPQVNLGTVDKMSFRNLTTLFDEMRSVRKRAAGQVSLSGHWWAADALSAADAQTQLLGQLGTMRTELIQGAAGQLNYGAAFGETVRILDFDGHINKLTNCIEWTLSASYTTYPNEADYVLVEIQVGTRENQAEGTVVKTLTGRIGAQSPEAAQSKLALLRRVFIPSNYILQNNTGEERRVDSQSNLNSTQAPSDGHAFIDLSVNELWQAAAGNILEWTQRIETRTDVRTTTVSTIYSGTVRAAAGTQAAAFAAASAQASALGAGKLPLLYRSNIVDLNRLFQTSGGQVFVTVEYSYEYEGATSTSYFEATSTRATDNYGVDNETVSGYAAAGSLAAAAASYQANVRSLSAYNGALVLSETLPTLNTQTIVGSGSLDQRYEFRLVLLRPKVAGNPTIQYDVQTSPSFTTRELTTTVSGRVWASTQVEAEAFLQTVLTGLNLTGGKLVSSPRTPHYRRGPVAGGAGTGTVFESMDFSATYSSLFTGIAGILMTEATEDILYSGNRNIEKMIPNGPSVVQQMGTTMGMHVVTARCVATTASAAAAWVRGIRAALLYSLNNVNLPAYEDPVRIATSFKFLPQVAGIVVGDSANVQVYEVTATFSEKVPELVFA